MKFLSTLLLLACLVYSCWAFAASWGGRQPSDKLLKREQVIRYPLNNNFWSVNVNYPNAGQTAKPKITAVFVFDGFRNTTGAQPTLFSGGPGFQFVTVNLRSQVSRGINSTIEVYGK